MVVVRKGEWRQTGKRDEEQGNGEEGEEEEAGEEQATWRRFHVERGRETDDGDDETSRRSSRKKTRRAEDVEDAILDYLSWR